MEWDRIQFDVTKLSREGKQKRETEESQKQGIAGTGATYIDYRACMYLSTEALMPPTVCLSLALAGTESDSTQNKAAGEQNPT